MKRKTTEEEGRGKEKVKGKQDEEKEEEGCKRETRGSSEGRWEW